MVRADRPKDYWLRLAPPVVIGREAFQVWAVPRGGKPRVNVDPLVEGISWTDHDAKMTGSLTLRRRAYGKGELEIDDGTLIILKVRDNPNAKFRELWRMRVYIPEQSITDGTMSFTMESDIGLLQASVDDWKYVKSRRRPKGWLLSDIVRDVCRRYGLQCSFPRTKHRVKNFVKTDTSPWDVVVHCMKVLRTETGRRYTIHLEGNRLVVRPLKRSARLLVLGPYLLTASQSSSRRDNFATAMTIRGRNVKVTARDKKGHRVVRHRKVHTKIRSRVGVSKYGYVHRIVYDPDADTVGEARAHGLRHISQTIRPLREASITHPGILGVKRGDAIRLRIPAAPNETGQDPGSHLDQVIFVREASWTVGPGDFTMSLTMAFEDPYVNKKVDRLTEDKDLAARRNQRKTKSKKKKKTPQAKKATQRATKPKGATSQVKKRKPPILGGVETPVVP